MSLESQVSSLATRDPRLATLRQEEFPGLEGRIYLNSASVGPLPLRSQRELERWSDRRGRPWEISDAEQFETMSTARVRSAALIGAAPEEMAVTTNTSFGLSLAAAGLRFERGDVVLFSAREFPANAYPWLALREQGVMAEIAPATSDGWPDEDYLVDRVQDHRVKLLAVSMVQFSNGYAVDLARLSAATRASGTLLVVDAIQGVGARPVDVSATPVDVLSCGGQKWLMSPWGSGFTYVRREVQPRLRPAMIGWLAYEGSEDFTRLTRYAGELHHDARKYELGTLPYQDIAAMNVSLELVSEIGLPAIQAQIARCHEPLLDWSKRRGVRVTSPADAHSSAIVCLAPPDAAAMHRKLAEAGIICSLREGSLRFAPHWFNTVEEVERVVEVME